MQKLKLRYIAFEIDRQLRSRSFLYMQRGHQDDLPSEDVAISDEILGSVALYEDVEVVHVCTNGSCGFRGRICTLYYKVP